MTLQAAGVHPNVVDCFGYIKTSGRQDEYRTVTRFEGFGIAECVLEQTTRNGESN